MKNPRALVIDGHNLIYRCFYGMPYLSTPDGEVIHGTFGTINRVREAIKLFSPHKAIVCWDGTQSHKSWRHDFFKSYKSNRSGHHDSVRMNVGRQISIASELLNSLMVPQVRSPLVEGDDAISSVVWSLQRDGYKPVILSPDHDFMQLVDRDVSVYDPMKVLWAKSDTFAECMSATKFAGLADTPEQLLDYMIVNGDTGDAVPMVKGLSGEKRWAKWAPHFKEQSLCKMLTSEQWFDSHCPDDLYDEFFPRYEELHRNWVLLDLKHARSRTEIESFGLQINEPHEHNFDMKKFTEHAMMFGFKSVLLQADDWRATFEAYHRRAK